MKTLFLKLLCKRLVRQGPTHRENIIGFYRTMYEAAQAEFTEDNKPTLDSFMRECHEEAMKG